MDMVLRCVSTARFAVKLNGGISGSFIPSRGLRQGDPLSPYLFLFCVEGFSALLNQAQREKDLRGVNFGSSGPHVTHLLFADDSIIFLEASMANMQALRDILHSYEIASGQKVNLQKSSIFFGGGCAEEDKECLKACIGIENEALAEKYLGLPTVVGRSKEGCFKNTRERSGSKVQGWKGQGLSKAAREVLVKAVLQATPTYSMSCFLFPKKLCRNLTTISSKFWWGAMNGERKVHWIAWDKMCVSKRNGGLGFRDMEAFNLALLAKQAWRLLTVPDSLCARVLKARYYKNSDLMAATCPKRGSFTWRSICHGKELLRHGVIWRIGNGEKVNIWSDNWIPRAGSMKPVGCKESQNVRVVADLLNNHGSGWNVDKLNYIFLNSDTCDIKQIRVGGRQQEDYMAWNFTRSGVFSVRSAYHL